MKRSDYMLAALASAVLPNLGVAGVRENVQASATDEAKGIDQTVIQDASGKLYDVYATNTRETVPDPARRPPPRPRGSRPRRSPHR